jgi:hypothetical protein
LGCCADAVSSIAEALRWRAVGRCASQQLTEQNMSLIRPELQVDTEQRQYFAPSWIGFRHIEQTANGAMARQRSTSWATADAAWDEFAIARRT